MLPAAGGGAEREVRVTLYGDGRREWDRSLWGEAGPGTLFRVR
jgi:hypothetical protein